MTEHIPEGVEHEQRTNREAADPAAGRDYWGMLRRRIWAMLTVFVLVLALGTVWVLKSTPVYESTAKILIERQTPRPTNFEEVVRAPVSLREYYRTQEQLLESRAVLEKAAAMATVASLPEITGQSTEAPSLLTQVRKTVRAVLGTPPPTPPEPWERLREHIRVEQVKTTHLLTVRAESVDATRAAALANAVASAFEQYHLERKTEISSDAFRFLQEQKDKQEKALTEAEDALQTFREKSDLVSLDATDKRHPVLFLHGRLNEQLIAARLERVELEAQFAVIEKALAGKKTGKAGPSTKLFALPSIRTDPTVTRLRAELLQAEERAAEANASYGPKHHSVQTATRTLARLHEELDAVLAQIVGAHAAKLDMLTRQEKELEQEYGQQTQQAVDLSRKALAFARLENEAKRQRKLFDVLVERLREVDVTSDYVRTNIEVVESADAPGAPSRPRKALLVTFFALLGLALGFGAALALERIDDTVKTPEDLENRVGLSVLGFIPSMASDDVEREGDVHRGLVVLSDPSSHITEAYRSIRTSLSYAAPPGECKAVLVTSGSPGDGKTTSAANLALVIAQSSQRVLLIDGDLRRPMLGTVLGLSSDVGLTSVLVGQATLAQAIQSPRRNGKAIGNLDVLVCGPKPPNPAELLDSQAMRDLLEKARGKYDRIVIDSPPVLAVADASIVAGISDGVILVVKAAANPRKLAVRAREQLESVNARILGGVLNDVHVHGLGYYDSKYAYYGYSSYYRSGYYASDDGGNGDTLVDLEETVADLERQTAALEGRGVGTSPAQRR